GKPVFSVSPCLRGEWCLGEALVNSIAAYIVIATCAALGAKTGMGLNMSYQSQGGRATPIELGMIARLGRKVRGTFDVWFGPDLPMLISAPVGTPPRTTDYPVAYNINIQPRNLEAISFQQMRSLADSFDLVRLCIETRKDQVSRMPWSFRTRSGCSGTPARRSSVPATANPANHAAIEELTRFFSSPDGEHTWQQWIRMLLEDLLVLDAPALAPMASPDGELWSPGKPLHALEVIDGATIARKIDVMGRTPAPPAVAYQ